MNITYRETWGAQHGQGGGMSEPPGLVVIHHFGEPHVDADAPEAEERRTLRGVERHHVESRGWSGIGYNWIVMPSGRIYEGRGWLRVGAHARGHNSRSCGIAVAMNADQHEPTDAAIGAVRDLIALGVEVQAIAPGPEIVGHRDVGSTSCPGDRLYNRLGEIGKPKVTEGDTLTLTPPELEPVSWDGFALLPIPVSARSPAEAITPEVLRDALKAEGFEDEEIGRVARAMERVTDAAEGAASWYHRARPVLTGLLDAWRVLRG